MPYSLQHHESVKQFLRSHQGLSRTGRLKLFLLLDDLLREGADAIRHEPTRRMDEDSKRFLCDVVFADDDGDGGYHQFWFVVNDSGAEFGVLVIEYIDSGRPPYRELQ